MKKFVLSLASCLLTFIASSQSASLYMETFETSSVSLPTGWLSVPSASAWIVSSSNNSTGYTGAGGGNNVKIDNTLSPTGSYSIITASVATTGYTNVTVSWGARLTNNFPPSTISPLLYYSTNGGTSWSSTSYTEASSSSTWKLNSVTLPVAAENQASVRFQIVANITNAASGTYRIDDFEVRGTAGTTGTVVTSIAKNSLDNVTFYVSDNTLFYNEGNKTASFNSVKLMDISGKEVFSKTISTTETAPVRFEGFAPGIYVLRVESKEGQAVSKKIALF